MKKGIFGILCVIFIYCILNLFVIHETLIQIEHTEPLNVVAQNSKSILTEQAENGFITDIVFPSSIFYKHAQIEIKSDISQNVVIKLAGPKVNYENTYKKYIIKYKKVHVNNEKILSRGKATFYLNPFKYPIDNLTKAIVDFEYKTDFVLRNMSLVCFFAIIIFLLIVLGYIFTYLYHCERVRQTLSSCFNSRDLTLLIINGYKNIQKEYKICFWINFLVLNIVYLYLNMNLLHGNHDWGWLQHNMLGDFYTCSGRFSIQIVNFIIEHKTLPVINNCLAFVFLALTPIFLVKYWKLPVTKFNIFAVSVPLLLHPQLLGVIYFLHLSYAYCLVPLLMIIALILSEKKNYKCSISSVVLLVFALGDYNVCINTFAVIFLGKMFLEYANGKNLIELFKKYFRSISIILLSFFIYFLIIQYLKFAHILLDGYYTTKLLTLDQILPRVVLIFVDSFRQFYLTYPFVDMKYLIILSLLFVLMFIVMIIETMNKKNILYLLGLLFIFIFIVFCSKIVFCIAETNVSLSAYVYYFSLPFVYVVAIAYIITSQKLWSKNLLLILLIPICYLSVIRDFEYQKFWKFGLEGDKYTISRLADRIKDNEVFLYDKHYQLINIGFFNPYNSYYYTEKTDFGSHAMSYPFYTRSAIIPGINYYFPQLKLNSLILIELDTTAEDIKTVFVDIPREKIMNLKPWPHKDSVLFYKNNIIVCWQEKELEYIEKVLTE